VAINKYTLKTEIKSTFTTDVAWIYANNCISLNRGTTASISNQYSTVNRIYDNTGQTVINNSV